MVLAQDPGLGEPATDHMGTVVKQVCARSGGSTCALSGSLERPRCPLSIFSGTDRRWLCSVVGTGGLRPMMPETGPRNGNRSPDSIALQQATALTMGSKNGVRPCLVELQRRSGPDVALKRMRVWRLLCWWLYPGRARRQQGRATGRAALRAPVLAPPPHALREDSFCFYLTGLSSKRQEMHWNLRLKKPILKNVILSVLLKHLR